MFIDDEDPACCVLSSGSVLGRPPSKELCAPSLLSPNFDRTKKIEFGMEAWLGPRELTETISSVETPFERAESIFVTSKISSSSSGSPFSSVFSLISKRLLGSWLFPSVFVCPVSNSIPLSELDDSASIFSFALRTLNNPSGIASGATLKPPSSGATKTSEALEITGYIPTGNSGLFTNPSISSHKDKSLGSCLSDPSDGKLQNFVLYLLPVPLGVLRCGLTRANVFLGLVSTSFLNGAHSLNLAKAATLDSVT